MGRCPVLHRTMHLEFALGVFSLFKLLKMYALCRQLRLVKKELAGEKKVVTTSARKGGETYKRTMAFLKPYLTSTAYHKTLKYNHDKLLYRMTLELVVLVLSVVFFLTKVPLKFWRLAGKMLKHPCPHSHVFFYLLLRFGFSMLVRLPFYYCKTFLLEKKHGHPVKSRCKFFRQFFACYFKSLVFTLLLVTGLSYLLSLSKTDFHVNALVFVVALALAFVWFVPFAHNRSNHPKPLEDPELCKEVDALGKKFGLSAKNVKVLPSNEKCGLPSQVFGFGGNSVLYLLESEANMGTKLVAPLLAHLVGHVKHFHFFKFFLLYVLKVVFLLFAYYHFKGHSHLFRSFGLSRNAPHVLKMEAFLFLNHWAVGLFYVFKRLYSHFAELQADNFVVKSGYGEDLPATLLELYKEQKHYFNLDPLYGASYLEKPSLFDRLYSVMELTPPKTLPSQTTPSRP